MSAAHNNTNEFSNTYNNANKILLKSLDGTVFETNIKAAKQCLTLKTMLEDCSMQRADADGVIPLMKVHSHTLQKILQWADHHQDDAEEPVPQPSNHIPKRVDPLDTSNESMNNIEPWDAEFMDHQNQGDLMDILLAANYLDIRGLMRLSCLAVAKLINMKERHLFDVNDDEKELASDSADGGEHVSE